MTEQTTPANETTVPVLPCVSVEDTLEFYTSLGFEVTYRQTRPYVYLALRWSGFDLHFGKAPEGLDPAREDGGACLVMVDSAAPYHAALVRAMRRAHGKVLATGRPRITRYRPGASRFTLVDPSGNSIVFVQRDEPMELEYGGSKQLAGLARALDNARVLREFKDDDRAAFRAVKSALRKYGEDAPAADRARALAVLISTSSALGEHGDEVPVWTAELEGIPLSEEERARVEAELHTISDLNNE
ncbi:VOC family protein [Streptomyces vinaceus]|uniref:glyoxalase n=1 Tax=Streptomyces vinaceus TaxID=1960 RepID=UPI0036A1CF34